MSTILEREETVGTDISSPGVIDRISRFLGLSVGQFYIFCAFVTLWEVVARYVFDAPTSWAFEVVMVLCATAWMLSVGYVTSHRRHIGITVFYLMAGDDTRWWLDLFGMVVGVFALYMLATDTLVRALESIDIVERYGSAFNSPQPMMLKTALIAGAVLYLAQLLTNLHRHFSSKVYQTLVMVIGGLMFLRLLIILAAHYTGGGAESLSAGLSGLGEMLDPRQIINLRDYDIGTVSIGIVITLILLMATGMPLGVVTLLISIVCALLFFGPQAASIWSRPTPSAFSKATRWWPCHSSCSWPRSWKKPALPRTCSTPCRSSPATSAVVWPCRPSSSPWSWRRCPASWAERSSCSAWWRCRRCSASATTR